MCTGGRRSRKFRSRCILCFYPSSRWCCPGLSSALLICFRNFGSTESPNHSKGTFLILKGVVLKCVFADNFALFVNDTYGHLAAATPSNSVLACYLYGLQIYCDFWGYTMVALGSAALLGIQLTNKFEHPYFASNIQHFWTRWHISLTYWLRDYIYFSLGGLRRPLNRYRNLFLTWLIAGLWHGTGLTFLIWGALHGLALAFYHAMRPVFNRRSFRIPGSPHVGRLLGWLVTFHFVILSWVPFRAESVAQARLMLGKIAHILWSVDSFSPADPALVFLIRLAAIFTVLELLDWRLGTEKLFLRAPALAQAVCLAIGCYALYFAPLVNVRFIYFEF